MNRDEALRQLYRQDETEMVFNAKWFRTHQKKILFLLNNRITKKWFRYCLRINEYDIPIDKNITEILPNSFSYDERNVSVNGKTCSEKTTDFRIHNKFANRLYFSFKPIWYAIHFFDWALLDRFEAVQKASFGFSTLTAYPVSGANNPCDGTVSTINQTNYTTAHNLSDGETASATDIELLAQNGKGGSYFYIARSFTNFDTSSLTSGATISSAVYSLYYRSDKQSANGTVGDQQVVAGTPASTSNVVVGDFDQVGNTVFATKAIADISSSQYYDFTLDANGRNNISKTGISKFALRARGDIESTEPSGNNYVSWYSADQTGTSNDPKLVVTYTTLSTTSITKSLKYTILKQNSITKSLIYEVATLPSWSNIKLWLDASFISGLNDGDAVTTWEDKTLNSYDATQSNSSYKPTYKTNIAKGKPIVRFSSASGHYMSSTFNFYNYTKSTIFVVFSVTNTSTSQRVIGSAAGTNGLIVQVINNGTEIVTTGNIRKAFSDTTTETRVVTFKYDGTVPQALAWRNGISKTLSGISPATQITGNGVTTIGSSASTINGDIAEVIIYNTTLSDTDRQTIENYLITKYIYVTTSISNTKSLKYSVLSSVSSTKSLKYQVSITKNAITKSLKYQVVLYTNIQKNLVYVVKSTPSALTKSLKYTIKTQAVTQKSIAYKIINHPTGMTKSINYLVTTGSEITKSLKYVVGSPVSMIKSVKYTIKTTATEIEKELIYIIAIPTITQKSLKYVISGTNSINKVAKYTITIDNSINRVLSYEVAIPESIQKSLRYVVNASHLVVKTLEYEVKIIPIHIYKNMRYVIRVYPYSKKNSPYTPFPHS